jgi:ParB/RepB/Spo0J family partition protein
LNWTTNPDTIPVREIPVSKLKHHPRNGEIYTLSNIDDLVHSIREVGLLQPLIVDTSNQVISGNRRLSAIRQLGWKKVEIEVVDVSEDEVVSLLIHHNKQRVKNTREVINEYHALAKIYGRGQGKRTDLTSVKSDRGETTRGIIAKKLGLSSTQVQRLLYIDKQDSQFITHIDDGTLTINQAYVALTKRVHHISSKTKPDAVPKSNQDSNIQFYNKSSADMCELDDGSVQMVFTSPPYWQQRQYTEGRKSPDEIGAEDTPAEYVLNLVSHLQDVWRVIDPQGSFFLNLGDKFHEMNLLNLPHRVVIQLQDRGWILRNTIVWHKKNGRPTSSKSNLQSSYEFIFHLTKNKSYYYDPVRVPSVSNTDKWKTPDLGEMVAHTKVHKGQKQEFTVEREIRPPNSVHDVNGNTGDGPSKVSYHPYIGDGLKYMSDFWDDGVIETAAKSHNGRNGLKLHPAPFQHSIVVPPLLQTTKEGDLILDPFHGVGTTGDVAAAFGRRYVGYDVYEYG